MQTETAAGRAIAHLNIIGFRAAVAALEDRALRGRPYVIAGGSGGRAIAWDVSPEALKQNIRPGMALAAAERHVRDLLIVAPNPAAYQKANGVIETVAGRYAPAWQNDGFGNLYLDISGTRRLFGPPAACLCRVQNEIIDSLGISAAAATASNKLVSKVASRAIRPLGLVDVRCGDEAAFLAHQDIRLLPGMGPLLLRTAELTGIREIGEIAVLSDGEAAAVFGKYGRLLRDHALGIDDSPVSGAGGHRIWKRADFPEDLVDGEIIRGALHSLVESAGLEMRNEKYGALSIRLSLAYADGIEAQGFSGSKRLLVTDNEIFSSAFGLFKKTLKRRIRLRSICLGLEGLAPLGYQADLFEPETEIKDRRLQEASDRILNRYGAKALMRGVVLAASAMGSGQ